MQTLTDTRTLAARPVGDLVAEDYRRAAALKRFGIDFCCGGRVALGDACRKKGVALADVAEALAASDARGTAAPLRVTSWSPAFLVDYVVNEHHTYVRESVPVLRAFTQKVARVHGAERPELVEIANLFGCVADELATHMAAEEDIVFPAIKALEGGTASGSPSLRDLVDEMESDHDEAGALMAQLRRLSEDYTPPENACNTYRAAFATLEAFEDDLHRHVHLENHVLFPKALALVDRPLQAA
jgi:regulator of cell morphogenesis and NO signaling